MVVRASGEVSPSDSLDSTGVRSFPTNISRRFERLRSGGVSGSVFGDEVHVGRLVGDVTSLVEAVFSRDVPTPSPTVVSTKSSGFSGDESVTG